MKEITAGTFDLRAKREHSFISIQTHTHKPRTRAYQLIKNNNNNTV